VELLVGRRNKLGNNFWSLTNPTNVVQTATYTVIPSANGCAGLPFDVVVSVNPKPDVNATTSVALVLEYRVL
jgi:hypothetical protein